MIYNNLIYFLVVIFALSTDRPPEAPLIPYYFSIPSILLILYLYTFFCRKTFQKVRIGSAGSYFKAERTLSILAIGCFFLVLYVFDLKYYLQPLTLGNRMPVFADYGGIFCFFIFLILMWIQARPKYEKVFHKSYSAERFVIANIKINLPILLPWLFLSLFFDLLTFMNIPGLTRLMESYWGDLVLFFIFVVFLMLFFPPLIRRLWNCTRLPDGPLRREIESFFRQQNFSAEILIWPLFEGQVLTAGVLGMIPKFRYVMITPALLQTMDRRELEAVLAHEIGHVKKKHLLLYVLLFLGFSVLFSAVVEPLPYIMLASEWFYSLGNVLSMSPEFLLAFLVAAPLLVFMVLYFRFIFGYFIRNFERQADLHVFSVLGESSSLISSFEKIAALSGNIRDKKNWHHFGIGERIEFLEQCERERSCIQKHNRKVHLSLGVYFTVIAVFVGTMQRVDFDAMAAGYESRYVEAVIMHKLDQEPDNGLWFLLLGDLMQKQKMEKKALIAYEKALRLKPANADIRNNLAWLLLTAQDESLRDPERALALAEKAAALKGEGYILDTLAEAYWANDMPEDARAAELDAIRKDPENAKYYRQQIRKFGSREWQRKD